MSLLDALGGVTALQTNLYERALDQRQGSLVRNNLDSAFGQYSFGVLGGRQGYAEPTPKKPETLREELQCETNEALKDAL